MKKSYKLKLLILCCASIISACQSDPMEEKKDPLEFFIENSIVSKSIKMHLIDRESDARIIVIKNNNIIATVRLEHGYSYYINIRNICNYDRMVVIGEIGKIKETFTKEIIRRSKCLN
jgi:hypothetical protein